MGACFGRVAKAAASSNNPTTPAMRQKKSINEFNNERHLIKSMLKAIELHNGGRSGLNFKKLCDDLDYIFGSKGSKLRNDFQKDWGTIKKRSFQDYVDLLDELGVPPGVHTSRAIQQFADSRINDMSALFGNVKIKQEEGAASSKGTSNGSSLTDTTDSSGIKEEPNLKSPYSTQSNAAASWHIFLFESYATSFWNRSKLVPLNKPTTRVRAMTTPLK